MGSVWMGNLSQNISIGQFCPYPLNDRAGAPPSGSMPGSSMNHTGFPAASRLSLWIAFLAISTLTCGSGVPLQAQSPNTLYKEGRAAENRGDFDTAYQD